MKKIILFTITCQFLISLCSFGQTAPTELSEFYLLWKITDLKIIEQQIQIKEKKNNPTPSDEIALAFLYGNQSFFLKKLDITQKYANYMAKMLKKYPENPLILGHYANSILSMARDDRKMLENKKMELFNQGMKVYDSAISGKYSNHFFLRFMRGATCFAIPNFFGRIKTAQEDFEWMTQNYENQKNSNPSYQNQDAKDNASFLYLRLGTIYQRQGDMNKAVKNWEKSVDISPACKWAKEAKESIEIVR